MIFGPDPSFIYIRLLYMYKAQALNNKYIYIGLRFLRRL